MLASKMTILLPELVVMMKHVFSPSLSFLKELVELAKEIYTYIPGRYRRKKMRDFEK
jgi:hypothetical protein